MKSLVKKTKKNVVSMNGTTVEFSPYEFIKKYNDWKTDMAGVSAGSIYSTKDLLETVRGHVNTATRRGRSKNSGSEGAFKVLDELDDLISEKQQLFLQIL